MGGRKRLIFIITLGAMNIILTAVLGSILWLRGRVNSTLWAGLAAWVFFLAIAQMFSERDRRSLRLEPAQYARTRKAKMSAAGYSFFLSIYIWMALMLVDRLNQTQVFVAGMSGMFLTYSVSFMIVSRVKH